MQNIFDTHAHYCSHQFDADREELLTALPQGGVVGVLIMCLLQINRIGRKEDSEE